MKLCAAQTRPGKGDVQKNIENHIKQIDVAAASGADIIVFPELSLTGYEPELANSLATTIDDNRFDALQSLSDAKLITICLGMPVKATEGILIGMMIFQPNKERLIYAKQQLHADELPYFIEGKDQLILTIKQNNIAPAICYESLQPNHSENAAAMGANIYLASIAKSQNGIDKAMKHFPAIAAKYAIHAIVANCVGFCDNFKSVGGTAVWNNKGLLAGQLNDIDEGLIIYDTETQEVIKFGFQITI